MLRKTLSSPGILIVEGKPLIALDMEYTLHEAGFRSVTLFTSCRDASEHIFRSTPSLAIVDVHLKDGGCLDLCRELVSRNVPIIVSSVVAVRDADEVFRNVVWLPKPIRPADLVWTVAKALVES
ncbi:response regulator [Rhizobium herbae]|jgi:DNA-binding response OmpR family regulator